MVVRRGVDWAAARRRDIRMDDFARNYCETFARVGVEVTAVAVIL